MPVQKFSQLAEMLEEFKQAVEISPTKIIPNSRRTIYLKLKDQTNKFVNTDLTRIPQFREEKLLQDEFVILAKKIENETRLVKAITHLHTSLHNRRVMNNPELSNVPNLVISEFEMALNEACSSMIVLVDEVLHRRNIDGEPFIEYKEKDSETLCSIIEATRELCLAPQDWANHFKFAESIKPLPRQKSIWIPLIYAAQIVAGLALIVGSMLLPITMSMYLPLLMFTTGLVSMLCPYQPSGLTFFREAKAAGNLKTLEEASEKLFDKLSDLHSLAPINDQWNDVMMMAGP